VFLTLSPNSPGFSGAGYADKADFLKRFEDEVIRIAHDTIAIYGPTAQSYFLLGARWAASERLRSDSIVSPQSGEIKNVIVGGLVADGAVAYHLEGVQKSWGDDISPKQDVILLVPSYKDAKGNQVWELKTNPDAESLDGCIPHSASKPKTAKVVRLELLEGGSQSIAEGIEFLLEARNALRPGDQVFRTRVGYGIRGWKTL